MTNTDNWTPWTVCGEDLTAAPNSKPASKDNIPSELRALGAAIGKLSIGQSETFNQSEAANDNLPPIVAFTGVAGSGKSTATRYLVDRHGYTLVKFAGPLKDMMRALGLDERQIEGDLKEVACDTLSGRTPRHAMQTLGTQWGRDCIADDFWIHLWKLHANDVISSGGRVVTDDCRFPNEAAAIRRLGGDIFKLAGRGGIAGSHESERMDFIADAAIVNSGSVEQLHNRVEEALRRYG